jgi:hypothetical protein
MFVIQVGYYAWLGTGPNGRPCVTTSGAHATSYTGNAAAAQAMAEFNDDRVPVLTNSVGSKRLLAFLAKAPLLLITQAEHDARMAKCNGRHGSGAEGHPAPRAAGTPTPAKPGSPVAGDTPAQPRPPGVTRQVYDWCLANPQATKADARAAFPSANPTTVGVQFGLARRAVA